jgi:hypothetical protein
VLPPPSLMLPLPLRLPPFRCDAAGGAAVLERSVPVPRPLATAITNAHARAGSGILRSHSASSDLAHTTRLPSHTMPLRSACKQTCADSQRCEALVCAARATLAQTAHIRTAPPALTMPAHLTLIRVSR